MRCWNCGEEIGEAHHCWKRGSAQEEALGREHAGIPQEAANAHDAAVPSEDSDGQSAEGVDDSSREPDERGEQSAAVAVGSVGEDAAEISISEDGKSTDRSNDESEPESGDETKKKRKRILYGSLAVVAAVILAVVVFVFSGAGLQIRKAGAWPDFPYLATLIDRPDDFVRALNCPDLQEAYNEAKSEGRWDEPIVAEIDIDELEANGADLGDGSANPSVYVRFNDEGAVTYFQLAYYTPTIETFPVEADDGNYFIHGAVVGEMGLRAAYGLSQVSDDKLEPYVDTVYQDCASADEYIMDCFGNPNSALDAAGINGDDATVISEASGTADWRQAYLLSCFARGFYGSSGRAISPIISGSEYCCWFELDGLDGRFLYTLSDQNYFTWGSTDIQDLSVQNNGAISIAYGREDYMVDPGEGTEYIESWAEGYLNADTLPLWSFKEGSSGN